MIKHYGLTDGYVFFSQRRNQSKIVQYCHSELTARCVYLSVVLFNDMHYINLSFNYSLLLTYQCSMSVKCRHIMQLSSLSSDTLAVTETLTPTF